MSYRVFFMFSSGLDKTLRAPKGTNQGIIDHIKRVEETLNLKTTQYRDNPKHWGKPDWSGIDDRVLCDTVEEHNAFVRWLHHDMAKWSKDPVKGGERITPAMASEWWHGLELLTVPPERWTKDYYRARMDCLYEVMRGEECDGIVWDPKKALTPEQAAAVIRLFADFLDRNDLRLDVPRGHDRLRSSYHGEYVWSTTCGAIDEDDFESHGSKCRKRECDVRQQWLEQEGRG